MVRIEIRVYAPTMHKGLRYRIYFNGEALNNNKFQAFDYKYNSILEQVLSELNYSDEQINKIVNTKDGYIVLAERW